MIISFDSVIADKYGVNEAIMVNKFCYWIGINESNGKNLHNGKFWTYNTVEALSGFFSFWTTKQVRTILESLKKQNVLVTGSYNTNPYDRTTWYAFSDEAEVFLRKHSHMPKNENAIYHSGKSKNQECKINLPDVENQNDIPGKLIYHKSPDDTNIQPNIQPNTHTSVPLDVHACKVQVFKDPGVTVNKIEWINADSLNMRLSQDDKSLFMTEHDGQDFPSHETLKACVNSWKESKNKKTKKDSSLFIPPTHQEVAQYFTEKTGVEGKPAEVFAEKFIAHYEIKDWMYGKGVKLKKWKQAVLQWNLDQFIENHRRPEEFKKSPAAQAPTSRPKNTSTTYKSYD